MYRLLFYSVGNVFNQKNIKSHIQHHNSIFVNQCSFCSTIIKHGSCVYACAHSNFIMLEENSDSIY